MILTLEKFQKLNFSEQFQKIGKSWYGGIKPIFGQMGKLELSVLFCRARTSLYLETASGGT